MASMTRINSSSHRKRRTRRNRWLPSILSDLENNVNEQIEPDRMSAQIVARILVKALMAMPAPDFNLCLFLIPERVQMEEQFKILIVHEYATSVIHLMHETGRFQQFWDEAVPGNQYGGSISGQIHSAQARELWLNC